MIATYRLSRHIPSFEFFNWLLMAKADGATEIVLDVRNPRAAKKHTSYGIDNVMERFRTIVEPGSALAGLPCRVGTDPGIDPEGNILDWCRAGRTFERLVSVRPPQPCGYTVTIRDNRLGSARARDSNRAAWEAFADSIGALVIDDHSVRPIHLHDRVALYAGAAMNYGVCNGPIHMLTQTPYPVSMWVNCEAAVNSQVRVGVAPGTNFPWMLDGQRLVWLPDTYDNLMREHERRAR